jgi:hypothetical protein
MKTIQPHKTNNWCLKLAWVLFIIIAPLQNSMAAWPVQFGGDGDEEVIDMAVDSNGNIIVVGMFVNKNYFPLGSDAAPLIIESAGGKDIFVASYNSGGNLNWVRTVGGTDDDTVNAVVIDHENAIYINGNIGAGAATFGTDKEASLSAHTGFSGKFFAGGSKDWAKTTAPDNEDDKNDVDLALSTTTTINAQQQPEFASELFGGYTAVAKSWKGYFKSIDADGNSLASKMVEGGAPLYRQEVSRIAASSATEVYVLGVIAGASNQTGSWCGTNIASGGVYPYESWVFVSKYQEINGVWTCQWLTQVDDIQYRGDIVTDIEGDVYYSASGLVKRLDGGSGTESILGEVDNRSLFIKPATYTVRYMDHLSTDLGGLAVDDEQNVYISGAYVGAPIFTDLDEAKQLRAVTTPSLFVAKLSANERSADPFGWKWATTTTIINDEEDYIAQKNARIGLSATGNTVFVAGSTSGYERFNDSIVGSQDGALSFDGEDDYLAFAVPDRIPGKYLRDYELSFNVKMPADAQFPLSLVKSSGEDGKTLQIWMSDPQTLEIRESFGREIEITANNIYEAKVNPDNVTELSFPLGFSINDDVWHKIHLKRGKSATYRTDDLFSTTFELVVGGASLGLKTLDAQTGFEVPLLPDNLYFGAGSTESETTMMSSFKGLLTDLSINLTHYRKYEAVDSTLTNYYSPHIKKSQWNFRQSNNTGTVLTDTLGNNDIKLTDISAERRPSIVANFGNLALSFDGVDNVISMPIPHDTVTQQIPVYELGFKVWFADNADTAYPQVLMSDNARFHLIMESPTEITLIEDRAENTEGNFKFKLNAPLQSGQWHTIKLNRALEIYGDFDNAVRATVWVDGGQIYRENNTGEWLYEFGGIEYSGFSAQAVSFGQTSSTLVGYDTLKPFNGFVDDLYINAEVYSLDALRLVDPNGPEYERGPLTSSDSSLKGLWEFNTPLTNSVIPNTASSGAMMDIDISGLSEAELPSQIINKYDEPRDGYISLLDAVSGSWLIPQSWEIVEAIALPDGALAIQPDIKIDGVLVSDYSSYLYWSPSEGKLYAIGEAPGIVTIEWKVSSDPQVETRVTTLGSPVQTSNLVQTHIAGTSVALEPANQIGNEGQKLLFSGVVYPANSNNLVTTTGQGKMFNRPPVNAGQPPYVVLQYTLVDEGQASNTQTQTSVFQVVYTKDWHDENIVDIDDDSCKIGQPLIDERHNNLSGRNGHVVNSLSRFDASIHSAGFGSIIPVNKRAGDLVEDYMGVVWFTANTMGQYWADTPVKYNCTWPESPSSIVIANQQGFELTENMINPVIYRQNNPNAAGYNPNEEHALLQDETVFVLRNDLNSVIQSENTRLGSDPYVLVKYQDAENAEQWAFKVLAIESSTNEDPFAPGETNDRYRHTAGLLLQLPQPLTRMGVCEENKITQDPDTAAWQDHKGFTWARAAGTVILQYYYPLQEYFDYDLDSDGVPDVEAGTCIPWLDQLAGTTESTEINKPINIEYRFEWPESVPLIKPGETVFTSKEVTCSNGAEAEKACYLPTINGQAAAQIIYDQTVETSSGDVADALVKLMDPLSSRSVPLLELNGAIATFSLQGKKFFTGLPFVLRSRLSYDEINQTLSFKGTFDDSQIGDPHLLPNIMTIRERDQILALEGVNDDFKASLWALYHLTRNPNQLDLVANDGEGGGSDELADTNYLIGLQPKYLGVGIDENGDGFAIGVESEDEDEKEENFVDANQNGKDDRLDDSTFSLPAGQFLASAIDRTIAESQAMLGTPMALTAGRPAGEGYITVAFNNHPSLSSLPVSLQVIKLDTSDGVYQGSIWIVPSDNIFEEALTLRHTADFAGDPNTIDFSWYYQPDSSGQPAAPDGIFVPESPWIRHDDSGAGALDVTISGPGLLTLSDNWFIARYGGKGVGSGLSVGDNNNVPSPWAGDPSQPANAPKAMLATGWIKRVIAGLNPFDQRVQNFHTDAISTISSMIAQAGEPFNGPIPFNPDPDVVNGVGIIEAYQTVLNRGKDLSISSGFNDIAANTQLLNASTRIGDLYMLLGNEAYADAQDPTIGFDTKSEVGSLASSIFTFQNQLDSPLEEELVLLRGRDDSRAGVAGHPVNNRLFWNFTQGSGEVAYAQSYRITDQNSDGFINETDARILYPQGHGDAWGHYLTSVKSRYELLQEPNYTWVPRAESVLVAGVPIEIDYMDERKFAAAAAAKARTGAEIVNLTYRDKYVEAPSGQWQGYKDNDRERAWGLDGWGRRSGQGAYLDWLTANAILPAEDPNPSNEGIEKIDRTTVVELSQIIAGFNAIQAQVDKADAGLNPLGLAKGVVPFDIDPSFLQVSSSVQGQNHFDQIASRAQKALDNAVKVFDHASQQTQSLRQVQDDVDNLTSLVNEQERGFKNRLIEIFGYAYAGDIGGGKTYPSDYDGPDLYHYMYVSSDLTGDLPKPDGSFTGFFSGMPFGGEKSFVFDSDSLSEAYTNVDAGDVLEVDFPEAKGADWKFVAPTAWGKRRAPGQLQVALSDLLQSQAQLQRVLKQHESLIQQIEGAANLVKAEYDLNIDSIDILQTRQDYSVTLDVAMVTARGVSATAREAGKILEEAGEATSECFPRSVGFSVDGTSSMRCAILAGFLGAQTKWSIIEAGGEIVELGLEKISERLELQSEIDLLADTINVDLLERIKELEKLWREEAVLRIELFTQSEVVNQSLGNYYAKLAEGQRLLEERRSFRVSAAGDTQQSRYNDMTFRIFRNDALAKYRAQFDLAARYVYLAAAAYDYETNLLGNESGSGREFLADIVRQRSLGQVIDGVPIAGTPGLADVLARLTQNFDVYRGQLGFNNPQVEENRFSLRKELFRLAGNDEAWSKTLEDARVANLWDIPEFKRYARPFAVESSGAQPGLVIRFPTTVTFGLNFFGHELGGGDSAYDPTNFATKVRAVGTWFEGYDGAALSNTPRVYLIPVGMDVLRSPSGDDFKTREWHVVDQKLPAPFPLGASDLTNPEWIPANDSLSDTYGDIRRMSSFRAYHDSGEYVPSQSISDSRLVGRSVWNTEWMLIIPGGTLQNDSDEGLNRFIHGQLTPDEVSRDGSGITDILLHFQTYGYSGN